MKSLVLVPFFILSLCLGCSMLKPHKNLFTDQITSNKLRQNVYYLASDEMQGRFFSSPGYDLAANYAASEFKNAGIKTILTAEDKNTYFQKISLDKVVYESNFQVAIGDKAYSLMPGEHFLVCGAPSNQKQIQGEAVFVGFSIKQPDYGWNDLKNINLKNKWVFLVSDPPDSILNKNFKGLIPDSIRNFRDRILNVFKGGAAGVICIRNPREMSWDYLKMVDKFFNERYAIHFNENSNITTAPIIFIDSTLTRLLFKDQPYDPITGKGSYGSFDLNNIKIKFSRKYNTTTVRSKNLVAVVPGSDAVLKNQYITMGAHLDHQGVMNDSIYNGADDNASGCAAVLEIAKAVSLSKPKRSVIFILYAAEEEGLLGSAYFINNAPVPVKDIKFNINLDMIGRPDGEATDLMAISAGKLNQKYKKRLQQINNKTEKLVLDTIDRKNFGQRSDQASFYSRGIPNLFFSTGEHIDYHKPGDDPRKIDYDFLQRVSRLSYHLIMDLANDQSPDLFSKE